MGVLAQCLFIVAFRVLVVGLVLAFGGLALCAVLAHAAYNKAWQVALQTGTGYQPGPLAALAWLAVVLWATWRWRA